MGGGSAYLGPEGSGFWTSIPSTIIPISRLASGQMISRSTKFPQFISYWLQPEVEICNRKQSNEYSSTRGSSNSRRWSWPTSMAQTATRRDSRGNVTPLAATRLARTATPRPTGRSRSCIHSNSIYYVGVGVRRCATCAPVFVHADLDLSPWWKNARLPLGLDFNSHAHCFTTQNPKSCPPYTLRLSLDSYFCSLIYRRFYGVAQQSKPP